MIRYQVVIDSENEDMDRKSDLNVVTHIEYKSLHIQCFTTSMHQSHQLS